MAMACTMSTAAAASLVVAISPLVIVRTPGAAAAAASSSTSSAAFAQFFSGSTRRFANVSSPGGARSSNSGVDGYRSFSDCQWPLMLTSRKSDRRGSRVIAKAVDSGETALAETKWGPPIQLATGKIPDDVDLKLFEKLLYQWGSSITQNANLPLPVPLKVDRIAGGVRLGYVKVIEAAVEEVCHIDVVVFPKSDDEPQAIMRALRNGKLKDLTPPAESLIMQSLLQALKTAVATART